MGSPAPPLPLAHNSSGSANTSAANMTMTTAAAATTTSPAPGALSLLQRLLPCGLGQCICPADEDMPCGVSGPAGGHATCFSAVTRGVAGGSAALQGLPPPPHSSRVRQAPVASASLCATCLPACALSQGSVCASCPSQQQQEARGSRPAVAARSSPPSAQPPHPPPGHHDAAADCETAAGCEPAGSAGPAPGWRLAAAATSSRLPAWVACCSKAEHGGSMPRAASAGAGGSASAAAPETSGAGSTLSAQAVAVDPPSGPPTLSPQAPPEALDSSASMHERHAAIAQRCSAPARLAASGLPADVTRRTSSVQASPPAYGSGAGTRSSAPQAARHGGPSHPPSYAGPPAAAASARSAAGAPALPPLPYAQQQLQHQLLASSGGFGRCLTAESTATVTHNWSCAGAPRPSACGSSRSGSTARASPGSAFDALLASTVRSLQLEPLELAGLVQPHTGVVNPMAAEDMVALAPPLDPLELGLHLQLLQRLGQGAHGVVYQGLWHGCPVAVKLAPARPAQGLSGALTEMLLARALAHPNVVQTYSCKVWRLPPDVLDLCHALVGRASTGSCPPAARTAAAAAARVRRLSTAGPLLQQGASSASGCTSANPGAGAGSPIQLARAPPGTAASSLDLDVELQGGAAASAPLATGLAGAVGSGGPAAAAGTAARTAGAAAGTAPLAPLAGEASAAVSGGAERLDDWAEAGGWQGQDAGGARRGAVAAPFVPRHARAPPAGVRHTSIGAPSPPGAASIAAAVRELVAQQPAAPRVLFQIVMEECDMGSLQELLTRARMKWRSRRRIEAEAAMAAAAAAGPATLPAGRGGGGGDRTLQAPLSSEGPPPLYLPFLNGGRWTPSKALRALLLTARELALGMAYLHTQGVIHGDLKPSNVLLRSSRADLRGWVAKLADFGLSTVLHSAAQAPAAAAVAPRRSHTAELAVGRQVERFGTGTGTGDSWRGLPVAAAARCLLQAEAQGRGSEEGRELLLHALGYGGAGGTRRLAGFRGFSVAHSRPLQEGASPPAEPPQGTLAYMAPEVLQGAPLDRPADVYSFGVVLWQLITGGTPYEGWLPAQIIAALAADDSPSACCPLEWPRDCLPALAQLGSACTALDVAFRPSFVQVASTIQSTLHGLGVC